MSQRERLTPEQIRDKARDHVGYGWTPRPGSWFHKWTDEDTATYMREYDAELARVKAESVPNATQITAQQVAPEGV